MDYENIWNKTLKLLEDDHEGVSFKSTVKRLKPLYLKNGRLVLKAPDSFIKETVEKRYGKSIESKLSDVSGNKLFFEIITDDNQDRYNVPSLVINLHPKYVFNTFVKGKSNCLNEASFCSCRK